MTDEEKKERKLQPEEAEALARLQEQIRRMTVSDHLLTMMESLASLAIRRLGATPETRAERDLGQARLAIDAFRALVTVVEPTRPEQEMVMHRSVLSDLQLAYVEALAQESGEKGHDEEAPRKDDHASES